LQTLSFHLAANFQIIFTLGQIWLIIIIDLNDGENRYKTAIKEVAGPEAILVPFYYE